MSLKVSLIVGDLSGGVAVRAYLLGQVLKKLDYEVEVVGFTFGKELFAAPPSGISVFSVQGEHYPAFLGAARKVLEQISGDVVYAVKPKPTSFGLALLKRMWTRRPVILDMDDWEMSWYGGSAWSYRPSLKQFGRDVLKPEGALRLPDHPLYITWMEKLVSRANALTVDTRFLLDRFGGTYLPNGKDTLLFDPSRHDPEDSRRRYGLSEYKVLMFPGPRPHKGLEDVLIALDKLDKANLKLVIVGGNPYDDYDDKLIQQWGRWIIKLPKCSVETMPDVVAAAHVVVVPQRQTLTAQSQFPLKLTDGMAMAKPILTTQVGDIPEILGGSGYLADPGSPDQLAECIQWILDNPEEATEQGIKARKRCVEHYSVDTMADILSDVMAGL